MTYADEPDAFPFFGNETLHGIARTSCRGHMVYLTATADEQLLRQVKEGRMACLRLTKRPHGHPLPVPRIFTAGTVILFVRLLFWLREHETQPRMVFVPSILTAHQLHAVLSPFFSCSVCTSKTADRDDVIERFREKKNGIIIATTVLERGVTVPGADICVYAADSGVFSEASLIQMAGRAGRSFQYPDGDVLFLCHQKSSLVLQCKKTIEEDNR